MKETRGQVMRREMGPRVYDSTIMVGYSGTALIVMFILWELFGRNF